MILQVCIYIRIRLGSGLKTLDSMFTRISCKQSVDCALKYCTEKYFSYYLSTFSFFLNFLHVSPDRRVSVSRSALVPGGESTMAAQYKQVVGKKQSFIKQSGQFFKKENQSITELKKTHFRVNEAKAVLSVIAKGNGASCAPVNQVKNSYAGTV